MDEKAFAVSSLQARGGLAQVTAFFFTDRLVLCDRGPLAAFSLGYDGTFDADVTAWCEASRAKARHVEEMPDPEIQHVRFVLRMMQNELWITRDRGEVAGDGYRRVRRAAPEVRRFKLMDREQTDGATSLLAGRFGPRFELGSTRTYAFFRRVASPLTK